MLWLAVIQTAVVNVGRALGSFAKELHLLLLSPDALLLLNDKATLGWRDSNKACTALQSERRRLWRASLFVCTDFVISLAFWLGRCSWGHHRALSFIQPLHAVHTLEVWLIALNWGLQRWDTTLRVVDLELFLSSIDQVFNLLNGLVDASKTDPFESWLATVWHLSLADETDRLQDIRNVIQAPDLRLEKLLIVDLAVWDLLCSLLKRQDILPCDKETDELLTEVAKRLDSFIFGHFLGGTGIGASLALLTGLLCRRSFIWGPVVFAQRAGNISLAWIIANRFWFLLNVQKA